VFLPDLELESLNNIGYTMCSLAVEIKHTCFSSVDEIQSHSDHYLVLPVLAQRGLGINEHGTKAVK